MTDSLRIPALLAAAGGAAWLAKMTVILATDGRVDSEGAAAVFFVLGAVLLAAGASVVTLRLARGRGRAAVTVAILASPLLFFASFMVLESIAKAVVGDAGPAWLSDEAGILLTGLVWLATGAIALRRA